MTYTPYHDPWIDDPDETTPITAAALNYIEAGIVDASEVIGVGTSLWQFTAAGALSVGDFTVTLNRSAAPIVQSRDLCIVIDPFTINCEIRQVALLSGTTLTFQAALNRPHSSGVVCYLTGNENFSAALWGADGSNNNNIDDWAALQSGMNETQLNACWLVGGGVKHVVRAPLFGSDAVRLRKIVIKAHPTLYTPAEATNALFMSSQNQWRTFTASASTDTFTMTVSPGLNVNQKVAFNAPQGQTLPGGIVAGRVYFIKTVPTALTFTISATLGGATVDVTSDGAGVTYSNINSLERVHFEFVNFSCNQVAGLNGCSLYLQQPAYTRDLRVEGNKGYGIDLGGQISNHYNLMLVPASGGVGMRVSGSGHNFYGTNLGDSVGNVADGIVLGAGLDAGCFDCNFYGVWTENSITGFHFTGTALGIGIHGWNPQLTTGTVGLKVDSGVASVNNSYVLSGGRVSVTNNLIQDDARGYAVTGLQLPQSTLTSWTQLAGDLAPILGGTNVVVKAADYTALIVDEVINVNAAPGSCTITLPAAAHIAGKKYTITKTDVTVNTVTVDGNASETINGATTKVLSAQYDTVTIVSNGTGWYIA